jgi:hypothetical protein
MTIEELRARIEELTRERDKLMAVNRGVARHGIITESVRRLTDLLSIESTNPTANETTDAAAEAIERLTRERDAANAKHETLSALVDGYRRERDEARAEVKRLKGAVRLAEGERIAESLAYVEVWCDATKGPCAVSDSAFPDGTHGHWRGGRRVELRVLLTETYRRGAEAMREACIDEVRFLQRPPTLETIKSLRALPIPEDKP